MTVDKTVLNETVRKAVKGDQEGIRELVQDRVLQEWLSQKIGSCPFYDANIPGLQKHQCPIRQGDCVLDRHTTYERCTYFEQAHEEAKRRHS